MCVIDIYIHTYILIIWRYGVTKFFSPSNCLLYSSRYPWISECYLILMSNYDYKAG